MKKYRLTEDPNIIYNTELGVMIPSTHRWWNDYEFWLMEGNTPDPIYTDEEIKEINQNKAIKSQDEVIHKFIIDEARVAKGLVSLISDADKTALEDYTKSLNDSVISPSLDRSYSPPLPPGVTPPVFESITITLTREPGFNEVLGWKAVITSITDSFVPTNLAMAWYNNPDCDGYVATSGAFQQDTETNEWFAICPPGFEPGDVDVHFGLLYASAPLSCFTMQSGEMSKEILAYEAN